MTLNSSDLVKKLWKPLLGYCVSKAAVDTCYGILATSLESRLHASGQLALWWAVHLAYFAIDVALATAFVGYLWSQRGTGHQVPRFGLEVIPDLSILFFLIHLAKLLRDPLIDEYILRVKLGGLQFVLLIAWVLWGAIIAMRVYTVSGRTPTATALV